MADMLLELQVLAERDRCETLAGLLALAHSEAQRAALRVKLKPA